MKNTSKFAVQLFSLLKIAFTIGRLFVKFLSAQTIQGGILLLVFPSTCAYYSRVQSVQGGILFKEIRYEKIYFFNMTEYSACTPSTQSYNSLWDSLKLPLPPIPPLMLACRLVIDAH